MTTLVPITTSDNNDTRHHRSVSSIVSDEGCSSALSEIAAATTAEPFIVQGPALERSMPSPLRFSLPLPETQRCRGWSEQLRYATQGRPDAPVFDGTLRQVLEPFLRPVREQRAWVMHQLLTAPPTTESFLPFPHRVNALAPIAFPSVALSLGVPYPALRTERPFLFDHEHSYPLHRKLAHALGVTDLARLHHESYQHGNPHTRLQALRDPSRRHLFHDVYDNFVTTFCIPFLHSLAMSQHLFASQQSPYHHHDPRVTYRYQAFPTIRVHCPGESASHVATGSDYNDDGSSSPTSPISCGVLTGHSVATLVFHIPLTAAYGTNALYVESHPGKENWRPLTTKAVGLGYVYDGARCLSLGLDNTTTTTAVSLQFAVLLYSGAEASSSGPSSTATSRRSSSTMSSSRPPPTLSSVPTLLCPAHLREDRYSTSPGSTYYDEAVIDLQRPNRGPQLRMAVKRHTGLLPVDPRSGPPFAGPHVSMSVPACVSPTDMGQRLAFTH